MISESRWRHLDEDTRLAQLAELQRRQCTAQTELRADLCGLLMSGSRARDVQATCTSLVAWLCVVGGPCLLTASPAASLGAALFTRAQTMRT